MSDQVKRWLQDSKVIDKNGKHLILYHGTSNMFSIFQKQDRKLAPGALDGFYFTSDRSAALEYGPNLVTVFVNLKNPFIGDPKAYFLEVHGIKQPDFGSPPEEFRLYRTATPDAIKKFLISNGYDGVIIPAHAKYLDHDEIIAFEPDQIRIMKFEKDFSLRQEFSLPGPA